MLAGIIQTIIMALGIATGNISSNAYKGGNVFNEVEESQKAPIKRQVDNININETYNRGQIYTDPNITKEYTKWYIGSTSRNANYWNGYVDITNTTYALYERSSQYNTCKTLSYMRITNRYRSEITYTVQVQAVILQSGTLYWSKSIYHTVDDINDLFDITLTENAKNYIVGLHNTKNWITDYHTSGAEGTTANTNFDISNYIEVTLRDGESVNLCMEWDNTRAGSNPVITAFTPNQFNMSGEAVLPNVNYEVVDIPGLMYTILTMPFSFISTAFNLTVFPNTPYQLNFGNLFLTLIAIFILLWLIKKVFH